MCSIAQAWAVAGEGVTRCVGGVFNAPALKARTLQLPEPYGPWRLDYIVHRLGGACVRLPPSAVAWARLVTGAVQGRSVRAPHLSRIRFPCHLPQTTHDVEQVSVFRSPGAARTRRTCGRGCFFFGMAGRHPEVFLEGRS